MDGRPHSGEIDIYARVSRASDDRQRSTAGQVGDCRQRLADRNLTTGETHIDNSRSAWAKRVIRPAWDALMTRLESGATGGVIVFDLARFSRRPVEGERLIAAAERGLLILDSENEYDLTTANGKKHFRDQMAGAAYESDRLSTRVQRGKKTKALRGEPNVSVRPFGFEPDGVTPRETEATVLRELTDRLLAGESQSAMLTDLNTRGVLTSYGKLWTLPGLRRVLTRHRNAGIIIHKGLPVGHLPGDPIIDPDVWERVCASYASRQVGRAPSVSYLASGIVMCGLCGHRLAGRPRKNMRPYPDGGVIRQYWCMPGSGGCGRIAVDQRGLDAHLKAFTFAVLSDRRHNSAVESAAQSAVNTARQRVDEEIADLEHLADQLAGRLGRREITLQRFDAATQPLDQRLAVLRAEAQALPSPAMTVAAVAASKEELRLRWEAAEVGERRMLLRLALRRRRPLVGAADRRHRTDVARRLRFDDPD